MVSRAAAFDDLVRQSAADFEAILGRRWSEVEFAVEDVPPDGPHPWEQAAPLARLFPAEGPLPARIVLYRRPIEALCDRSEDAAPLVHEILLEQVATVLGVDPGDIEPTER